MDSRAAPSGPPNQIDSMTDAAPASATSSSQVSRDALTGWLGGPEMPMASLKITSTVSNVPPISTAMSRAA